MKEKERNKPNGETKSKQQSTKGLFGVKSMIKSQAKRKTKNVIKIVFVLIGLPVLVMLPNNLCYLRCMF